MSEFLKNMPPQGSSHPEIVQHDNGVLSSCLRLLSQKLEDETPVGDLVAKMRRILGETGGISLAAPQIGVNKRVILVRRFDKEAQPVEAFLNPRILSLSTAKEWDFEGCLSISVVSGKIERCKSVALAYFDEGWNLCSEIIEDLTARLIQHEIDHLDGILLVDNRADPVLLANESCV